MLHSNIELKVLVKNKPITEYSHDGKIYIEGRSGSEFSIQIRNNNYFRVEAILSVDGLSVTDGKDAGPDSRGYLIEGNSSVIVPGWMLNHSEVAAFEFGGKSNSYAQAATGSTRNVGVIGLMVYRENQTFRVNPILRGIDNGYYRDSLLGQINRNYQETTDSSWKYDTTRIGASASAPRGMTKGISQGMSDHVTTSFSANAVDSESCLVGSASIQNVNVQNLGTQFGQATAFNTRSVNFDRGALLSTIVIYYDDKRGLLSKGVEISRPKTRKVVQAPQAFPGAFCTPPKGWRG